LILELRVLTRSVGFPTCSTSVTVIQPDLYSQTHCSESAALRDKMAPKRENKCDPISIPAANGHISIGSSLADALDIVSSDQGNQQHEHRPQESDSRIESAAKTQLEQTNAFLHRLDQPCVKRKILEIVISVGGCVPMS
jgi:hypothetical protein